MKPSGAGTAAVLAFIVVAAVNLPRNVLNVFNIPMLRFGNDLPYLGPLCLLLLAGNLVALKGERRWVIPVGREDKYFVVAMVVWTLLELPLASANLYLVWSNLWFFVFYALFRSYVFLYGLPVIFSLGRVTAHTTIAILIYHLALQLIVITGAPGSGYIDAGEVSFSNGMAFLGLFLLHLLMFHLPQLDLGHPVWYCRFAASLALAVIIINGSRAATLTLFVLVTLKALYAARARLVALGAVGLLFLLASLSPFEAIPFGDWLGLDPIARQAELISTGVGSAMDLSPDVVYSLPGKFVSAYSRVATVVLAGQAIAQSPIVGHGLSIIFEMTVAKYILHSYLLYPVVAYGLVGTVPYLFFFASIFHRAFARVPRRAMAAFAFLVAAMVFDNEIRPWYAVLLILLKVEDRRALVRSPVLALVEPAARRPAVL